MCTPEWIVAPVADGHVVADGRQRINVDVRAELRRGADDGQGADAGAAAAATRLEVSDHGGEGPMGVHDLDGGHPRRSDRLRDDRRRRATRLEALLLVPPVDQGDLSGLGIAQGGGPFDHQVAAADQTAIDHGRQLRESCPHTPESFPRRPDEPEFDQSRCPEAKAVPGRQTRDPRHTATGERIHRPGGGRRASRTRRKSTAICPDKQAQGRRVKLQMGWLGGTGSASAAFRQTLAEPVPRNSEALGRDVRSSALPSLCPCGFVVNIAVAATAVSFFSYVHGSLS